MMILDRAAAPVQGLNLALVHKFAAQLLHTLAFLRAEGIIHCDLKPENILLQNSNYSHLKARPAAPAPLGSASAPTCHTYIQMFVRCVMLSGLLQPGIGAVLNAIMLVQLR
jgi:serine/threonine protein kinase